jgi:hypothetical protein
MKTDFLSMAEVEEAVKKRMAKLKPILLKQKIFTNIVSLWNLNGQYVEITQNTNGHYDIYLMSEREANEWDKDDGSHCEDLGINKIGEPPDVIVSESLQIRRKKEPGK